MKTYIFQNEHGEFTYTSYFRKSSVCNYMDFEYAYEEKFNDDISYDEYKKLCKTNIKVYKEEK